MAQTIIGMGAATKKADAKELQKKLAEETAAKEKALSEKAILEKEAKKLASDLKKANETIASMKETEGGSDNGTDSKDSSGGTGKSKDKK